MQEVSSSGLLRHFSMKTTGASTVIDATGTANATLTSATPTPGIIGQALDFDGANSKVDTGSDMIGTGDDSVSAWIYARSYGENGYGRIIENGQFIVYLFSADSGFSLAVRNTGGDAFAASNSILLNRWINIVGTKTSNGTVNLYVNGILSGVANQAGGTPVAGNTNVILGNNSGQTLTFDGYIDEVRIYNRILTTSEITELYTQGNRVVSNGVMTKGLIAHYSLAQEDLASASVINDLTPNNRDGTITAGTGGFTTDQKGQANKAYNFDGANTTIPTTLTSNTPFTNGFTVSAWIKPNSIGETNGRVIDKSSSGDGVNGFSIWMSGSFPNTLALRTNVGSVGYALTGSTPYGVWQHMLVTVASNAVVTWYINGVQSGTPATTGPLSGITTSNPLTIGNRSGATDRTFDGGISDVKIYNRVLTTAEIAQLYQSYRPQLRPSCGYDIIDGRDSQFYNTVKIGAQCWTAENMNAGTKIDDPGSAAITTACTGYVGQVVTIGGLSAYCTTADQASFQRNGVGGVTQKYCYSNSEANCTAGGGLYEWQEAMDLAANCAYTDCSAQITTPHQGICPAGWHIPTDTEYKTLEGELGMSVAQQDATGWRGTTEGDKLKIASACYGGVSCNSSGFSAVMTGIRNRNGGFSNNSSVTVEWSSSQDDSTATWMRELALNLATARRNSYSKTWGNSVRCLKD